MSFQKARSAEELRAQLEPLGGWMYRFDLGYGIETAIYDEYLDQIHRTRWSMIRPKLERQFAARWPAIRALDAACNEGWFAIETARLGAGEVVGFDAREINIQKAEFARVQLGCDNVRFRVDNIFNIRPDAYGTFDLVLCLGLMYHLEDPMGALRRLRSVTRELCVIDTEVVRPGSSATIDRGPSDGELATGDIVAVIAEPEFRWNPLSSVTGISLVPNLHALQVMLKHAGFTSLEVAAAPPDAAHPYAKGDRVIIFAGVSDV
jgi:SAM-dependent methyltransferase